MALRNLIREWSAISLEKKLAMFVAPLFVTVAGGLLVGVMTGFLGGNDAASPGRTSRAPEKLDVIDLAVAGGTPPSYKNSAEPPPGRPSQLDVTLRNVGSSVSVLKRAELKVLDFGLIEICQAGGGLEPTAAYDVTLPSEPKIGETIDAKVSQQIKPNEADRFLLRLNVSNEAMQFGSHLYQLDVRLYHDTSETPLELGKVVVSLPYDPSPQDFPAANAQYYPEKERNLASPWGCYVKNEAEMRRLLSREGVRSSELNEGLLRAD
jgi:hypothetical protein